MAEAVILVPGLGFGGSELLPLARQLRQNGFDAEVFYHYPASMPLAASAEKLWQQVANHHAETIHFVAHSLGGLATLQMLSTCPLQKPGRPGRVVLLGTPLVGSLAARRVLKLPGGKFIIGTALASASQSTPFPLPADRDVGMIAGRWNLFVGLALCPGKVNDSVVCVEETDHPGLTEHCIVPATHTTLLLNPAVAERVVRFLRTGQFGKSALPEQTEK